MTRDELLGKALSAYAKAKDAPIMAVIDEVLEACAEEVARHDKKGREWIPGSLWDQLTRESASRIRQLKGQEDG